LTSRCERVKKFEVTKRNRIIALEHLFLLLR
jgi:hypothetical protein